jgi:outer membrane immunogenic protein
MLQVRNMGRANDTAPKLRVSADVPSRRGHGARTEEEASMRASIVIAAAAAAALSGPALAADLPARTMAPAPAAVTYMPVFTWTGLYVGLNAGYGWRNSTTVTVTGPVSYFQSFSDSNNGGFVGGGQIGYNWQTGAIVFGAEADIQYADLGGKHSFAPFWNGGSNGNYFGTVRGRVGFAFDRALIYATGGLAYGDVGQDWWGNNSTRAGWTLGAGVEYAFTNNWTARVEGLWVKLDKGNKNGVFYYAGAPYYASSSKNDGFGVIRAAINYKF